MIENSKKSYIQNKLEGADVKTFYRTVNGLLNNGTKILPTHDSIQCLADDFLDYNTCNDIVCSLVLSRLDYGNVLLMGANAKQIARLQVLQNWAAKLIFCVAKKN